MSAATSIVRVPINTNMPAVVCGAIIAGGASRRMGRSKALLELDGKPLVARVARVLQPLFPELAVVTSDTEIAEAANLASIPDEYSGRGPLAGIHAALKYFRRPVFCVACDLPFLQADVIRFLTAQLGEYSAVLPRVAGRSEPLHAVYSPSCLPVIEAALQQERVGRIERVLEPLRVKYVAEEELRKFDSELRFLRNLNTPGDVRAAGFSL